MNDIQGRNSPLWQRGVRGDFQNDVLRLNMASLGRLGQGASIYQNGMACNVGGSVRS